MNKFVNGIILLTLAAVPAFSNPVLFQGIFDVDSQFRLFSFTADSPELVTFQTYSYAGGSFDSTSIPSGGFVPAAYIFDGLGGYLTLGNGACGQVGRDSQSSNCDDLFYQNVFGPGTFIVALTVYDNHPVDDSPLSGFSQDGNPGFTCQEAQTDGAFCDVTTVIGESRTGSFAFSITGADSVENLSTPEPGSWLLLLTGGVVIALKRRTPKTRHS